MSSNQRWAVFLGLSVLLLLAIYVLEPILSPFLIAFILAYLGDPLVKRLVSWKVPRTLAAIVVFIIILLIIALLFLLLIPLIQTQVQLLLTMLPKLLLWLENSLLPWLQSQFGLDLSQLDLQSLKSMASDNMPQTGNFLAHIAHAITQSSLALVGFLVNLVLVPVVTFYLLRDWDKVVDGIHSLLPRHVEPTLVKLYGECDEVLGAFLRGQLLVMLSLGIIYALGLSMVGLDTAVLIGMSAGLASVVPYLGFIVGIAMAIIASLVQYHDVLHLVYVVIVFAAGQMAESMVLTPWLVGDRIGLHPVAVIFSIMAGGVMFGFVGILLALPVAAVVLVCLRYVKNSYMHSELYNDSGSAL